MPQLYNPLGLLAELTHRCPLELSLLLESARARPASEELDTETWARVFAEAADSAFCRCISPAASRARGAISSRSRPRRMTAAFTPISSLGGRYRRGHFAQLAESGLDHVQISIQDSERTSADRIAGIQGAFARKRALAAEVIRSKNPAHCQRRDAPRQ